MPVRACTPIVVIIRAGRDGLPEPRDRAFFIEKMLVPCHLNSSELNILAEKSHGCSYNEIQDMIGDVIEEKWNEDLQSPRFMKSSDGTYVACSEGGIITTFDKLPVNSLRGEPIKFEDLDARFETPIKRTSEDEIQKMKEFMIRNGKHLV